MTDPDAPPHKPALDNQRRHWESALASRADMFGAAPSAPAQAAAALFKKDGLHDVLELGPGQGRDTLYFAQRGSSVTALDYVQSGLDAIAQKATAAGLRDAVTTIRHDVREPLPFGDAVFDACYSHMLYCMALTTRELETLSADVLRVLRPGGLHVYTVRHTGDAHYCAGIHRGEDMYEVGGFIVHFFSLEKVRRLAAGYEIVSVEEFEEGGLPRKLFRVALRKPRGQP